jgi:3-dehydroquinate synthase
MRNLTVKTRDRIYPVFIGQGLFEQGILFELDLPFSEGALITNQKVGPLHAEKVQQAFRERGFELASLELPDGEEFKTLASAEKAYHFLLEKGLDRKSFLVTLGGGVITDLGGFVASTFMRGIAYYQVPTSLLAQVDSSVGGKTGVNLEEGKNLVGTFYQPYGVIIELSFLETLPEREYREGLAEVAKAAFLAGGEFLELLSTEGRAILERDYQVLEEVVGKAVAFKKEIVEQDERERGLRSILNYGHTVAHGLEKALGYGVLRHGEAVAVGMMVEAMIGLEMGITRPRVIQIQRTILQGLGLPLTVEIPLNFEGFWAILKYDKKREAQHIKFALLRDFGDPVFGVSVPEEVFKKVFDSMRGAVLR